MNRTRRYLLITTAAAVCALTPGTYAEPSVDVNAHASTDTDTTLHRDKGFHPVNNDLRPGDANPSAHADVNINTDRNGRSERTDRNERMEGRHGVADYNKASGIIGMEVRNNMGDKIGTIKDLVVDLNTGQVSYAVLAVGGFLGIGEKLIALPPSALQQDPQDSHKLVLNADKEKIMNATGFAATNWPEVGSKPWGAENYWNQPANGTALDYQNSTDTGHNSSGNRYQQGSSTTYNNENTAPVQTTPKKKHWWNRDRSSTSTSSSYDSTSSGINASSRSALDNAYSSDHGVSVNANVNGNAASANVGTSPSVETGVNVNANKSNTLSQTANAMDGSIKAIDPETRTMTIITSDGTSKTFRVGERPNLTLGNRRNVLLSDFKPGYGVEVGYHQDGSGNLVADSVIKRGPLTDRQ
jgi:sporulation protein YlmC with PRC-barrel domain